MRTRRKEFASEPIEQKKIRTRVHEPLSPFPDSTRILMNLPAIHVIGGFREIPHRERGTRVIGHVSPWGRDWMDRWGGIEGENEKHYGIQQTCSSENGTMGSKERERHEGE